MEHEGAYDAMGPAHLLAEQVVGGIGDFASNADVVEVGNSVSGCDEA